MLRGRLIHPEILAALGSAGHGAKILLADGNYPVSTRTPSTARRVYLNLAPGLVTVTDVLAALVTAVPIEAAEVMVPPTGREPPILAEFRRILAAAATAGTGTDPIDLALLDREAFYEAASDPAIALAVATGERRIYANLLLTIGVLDPDAEIGLGTVVREALDLLEERHLVRIQRKSLSGPYQGVLPTALGLAAVNLDPWWRRVLGFFGPPAAERAAR